jgi:hypothetical protein
MKPKSDKKKLLVKRETLRTLGKGELGRARGGTGGGVEGGDGGEDGDHGDTIVGLNDSRCCGTR